MSDLFGDLFAEVEKGDSIYDKIRSGELRVTMRSAPELRFWKGVNKDGPIHPTLGQCWVWTAAKDREGYGKIIVDGKKISATYYSWFLVFGTYPASGKCMCHSCDNPTCVRPSHLFIGTPDDNRNDCVAKGRHAKGENTSHAVLTEAQVIEIRNRYRRYSRVNGVPAIAKDYGVWETTIEDILARRTWKHI